MYFETDILIVFKHHNSFRDKNEQFFSRFLYFVLAIEIL